MSNAEYKIYKKQILRQLAAFGCLNTKGFDYACRLYPEDVDFLRENKNKSYDKVRRELSYKLEHV
jgi:hypothetical protein